MGRLKLCRICLVENVRMFIVADSHLQEVFEKLTNIPFMKEDRPMLACFYCYTRLKQCHHFMMKCQEAEEVFAQMLNEDYEHNQLRVRVDHQFFGGLAQTQIVNIDIVDGELQVVSVKEELPVDGELQVVSVTAELPVDGEPQVISFKEELSVDDKNDYDDLNEEDDHDGAPLTKKAKLDIKKHQATISTKQKKNSQVNTKVINKSCANKSVSDMKESTSNSISQSEVNNCIMNNKTMDTKCATIDIINCNDIHEEELKCKICDYIAINSEDINQHTLQHSNVSIKEEPNDDMCLRTYTKKGNIKLSKRLHTVEKLYKCDVCQKSFTQEGDLKQHTPTHTEEKPYKCNICQSSFSKKITLKNHKRTHTVKSYKCVVCQRSFGLQINLDTHMHRIHTGEKPNAYTLWRKHI